MRVMMKENGEVRCVDVESFDGDASLRALFPAELGNAEVPSVCEEVYEELVDAAELLNEINILECDIANDVGSLDEYEELMSGLREVTHEIDPHSVLVIKLAFLQKARASLRERRKKDEHVC